MSEAPTEPVAPSQTPVTDDDRRRHPKPPPTTEYIILTENDGSWVMGPKVNARSSGAAVRQHATGAGDSVYVAVPARSWFPVTATIETKTQLTFS